MPKPTLPFLHRYQSRHGKVTYYVKLSPHERGRGTRVEGLYRSDEFMQNYHALVRGTPILSAPVAKDGNGTLGWLIRLYREARLVPRCVARNEETARPDPEADGKICGRSPADGDHTKEG